MLKAGLNTEYRRVFLAGSGRNPSFFRSGDEPSLSRTEAVASASTEGHRERSYAVRRGTVTQSYLRGPHSRLNNRMDAG